MNGYLAVTISFWCGVMGGALTAWYITRPPRRVRSADGIRT